MLKRTLLAIFLATATGASADETFVATLVPVPGSGSSGTGSATLVLSADETQLSFNITFSGLSGAEIQAHIHQPDGTIAFGLPLGSPKIGIWSNPGFVNVAYLRSEQMFILIHTTAVLQGEVRGDIVTAPTPVEPSTWGGIKALFGN